VSERTLTRLFVLAGLIGLSVLIGAGIFNAANDAAVAMHRIAHP
jgi:hypothetical protein